MPTRPLPTVLRDFIETFLARSMHATLRFVRERDLTMAQYSTLMRLYHQADCGVSAVGDQLGVTAAAASQLVDKLVQAGLVARTEPAHDRRQRLLALTERGRELVRQSFEARLHWTAGLAAHLPPEQQAAVAEGLERLLAAARQAEAEPAPHHGEPPR